VTEWRDALAPTPECLAIERLAEELTTAEREHAKVCVRCQAELALFRDVTDEPASPASQWVAAELQRRAGRPASRPALRAVYAVAAALIIAIGLGSWLREPSIEMPRDDQPYRSASLELLAPAGDLARAPNELRWANVPHATRYQIRILEVDSTVVWSGTTTQSRAALPPDVIAQFRPGKSLQWDVRAFRGNELLAVSETQTTRVTP
jgi:hypothetical protein